MDFVFHSTIGLRVKKKKKKKMHKSCVVGPWGGGVHLQEEDCIKGCGVWGVGCRV